MDVVLQRTLVESALESSALVKGACWCVIDKSFWDAFCGFVGLHGAVQTGVAPGLLTHHQMLDHDGKSLKPGLQEGEHYVLVPKNVFDMLKGWYGGHGPIERFVIEEGEGSKAMLRVEVYLLKLRIVVWSQDGNSRPAQTVFYSKKERVGELLKLECKKNGLDSSVSRVFTMDGDGDEVLPETFLALDSTLEDSLLAPMQRLFLQSRPEGKPWPPVPTELAAAKQSSTAAPKKKLFQWPWKKDRPSASSSSTEEGVPLEPQSASLVVETSNLLTLSDKGGLCGLQNLGNTCFMNGAVQALLHCEPLVSYFFAGLYKKEINKKNPLGMKGELALALAELTKEAWRSSSGSAVSPKQLKHVIGRFAPQFQGYQQHDSHELLAFLLDGVHEDLNRVHEKVYVEMELKGELDDRQRAKTLWEKHELRNRSIIVDLFHAQLKSTIVCPTVADGGCGRQSVTFDAFAYLSLPVPLPEGEKKFFEVAVMRDPSLNGKPWFCEMPIKYSVEVSPGNSMSDVSASLTSLCAVDPAVKHAVPSLLSGRSLLVLCEQLGYKIFKTYQSLQSASMVTSREQLFGYELPRGSATELYSHVSFSHARPGTKSSMLEGFGLPFSCPFFIDIPITVLSFYQTVFRAISCYVRDELWTSIGAPIFIPGDSTSEQILNAKAELQKNGPPDGSVQPDGCWRVEHRHWTENDEHKGFLCLRYQVLKNRNVLSAFPFQLRWGCDSYNSTCLRCGDRKCGGCDIAATADEKESDPELSRILLLNLRGKLSMVIVWTDPDRLASFLDAGVVLNVRLNASVKANRAISANAGRKTSLTLQDCLNHFQQNEKLDKNNTWYCSTCKDHKEAWKMMQIYSLPTVMVVQLKRFRNQNGFRQKIGLPVVFPITGLDMGAYVLSAGSWVYDLFAVVNHLGDLGGGHYTAYAKHHLSGKWYLFDDSRVSLVENESSIISTAAYILFYERRQK